MAIVRKTGNEEKQNVSSSKKIGKANSKAVKKRDNYVKTMDGVALQLDKDGKVIAPEAKKKENKKISSMVNNAKN